MHMNVCKVAVIYYREINLFLQLTICFLSGFSLYGCLSLSLTVKLFLWDYIPMFDDNIIR
jgi:hypothetical protein